MAQNSDTAKLVKLKIIERGNTEKARLEQLFSYSGPDQETIDLLDQNHGLWSENPFYFWAGIQQPYMGKLDSQADIVMCYVRSMRATA